VIAGLSAFPIRNDEVCYEHQNCDSLDECSDRNDQVQGVPTAAWFVGIDAARHTEQARDVHDVKRHVKAEHEEPEMEFAQAFAHHSSGDFRVSVIKCSKEGKQNSTDNHIVKVRHYKVREAELPIERSCGLDDFCEVCDQKLEEECDAE